MKMAKLLNSYQGVKKHFMLLRSNALKLMHSKSDQSWPVQNTETQIHKQEISMLTVWKSVQTGLSSVRVYVCMGNWQLCSRTIAITQQGGCKWLTLLLLSPSRKLCLIVMPLHHTHSTHMQTYTQRNTTNPSCLQYVLPHTPQHTQKCKIYIRTNFYILTLSSPRPLSISSIAKEKISPGKSVKPSLPHN